MDNIPQDDTPRKQCNGPCGQTFPATSEFFSRDKTRKDGLQVLCKKCMSEYKKQYYLRNKEGIRKKHKEYQENNKEKLLEQKRLYYRENKEEILNKHKVYWAKNRERFAKTGKAWRQAHKEEIRLYHLEYKVAHKDELTKKHKEYYILRRDARIAYLQTYFQTEHGKLVSRVHSHKRRAKKRAVGGSYTTDQLQDQLKRQKHKCYWCGAKLGKSRNSWHADHIVPLSRENTSNEISNIVIACRACNLQRNNKLPHEWPDGGRLL